MELSLADTREGGLFVTIEGGEGCGKSTQVDLLLRSANEAGVRTLTTREPGATPLGIHLRQILLQAKEANSEGEDAAAGYRGGVEPRAEALLYAADRAQHVAQRIRPALARGELVISDRYRDSSVAYQGAGRALDAGDIATLSSWASGGLDPDLTILLDGDPRQMLRRLQGPADRLETLPLDFHDRVRQGFRALANANPERYLVIDARLPVGAIGERIWRAVKTLWNAPARPGARQAPTHLGLAARP